MKNGLEHPKLNSYEWFASHEIYTSRIKAFTDDKTSDDTHDGKVASGIKFLQNAEKAALQNLKGDSSFTFDTAREVANQTKSNNSVFKNVNVVQKGVGFNYQLIASETIIEAADPTEIENYLEELRTNPVSSLTELEKIEPGVTERYVRDYVMKKAAGDIKQEFRTYIGGRASRKLGKVNSVKPG